MSRGVLLLILAAATLVAVGCDHVVRRTGGMLVSIAPVCEDTGRPPKEFVLEVAMAETRWATTGGGRSHVDVTRDAYPPVVRTMEARVCKAPTVYAVPVYAYFETRRFPGHGAGVEQIKGRDLGIHVYCEGYELGRVRVPFGEEVKASSAAPPCRLKRFDCSTKEFSSFWYRLRADVMLAFPRLMAAWEKASRDPVQRPAIERIYRWHIARYEAAVQQKPELLKEQDAARHVNMLREKLAKLTAKNSNRGK